MNVSVVVTCYNYGHFLTASIESALAQTCPPLEVIVVDDGSEDETPKVMKAYARHPRIVYVRQANRGQAAAKNVGIARASGELIAFLDADDLWLPAKLEKQVPYFAEPSTGVVYSAMSMIDQATNPLPFEGPRGYLRPRSGRITDYLVFDNFVPFSSAMVRQECFARAGRFDESLRMGIDWDLWLRVSLHYDFQAIDAPLLRYRVGHVGQMSLRTEERIAWSDVILEKFVTQHPNAVDQRVLRRARAYSCVSRAAVYRRVDWARSTSLLIKALTTDWTFQPAYRSLAKNLALPLLRGRPRVPPTR